MINKTSSSGYFSNGLPYNRAGHGSKPLVIFQGLMFENKPQSGMTFTMNLLFEPLLEYLALPTIENQTTLSEIIRDR